MPTFKPPLQLLHCCQAALWLATSGSPGLHHGPHNAHGLHQLALARLRLWRAKHIRPQLGGGLRGEASSAQ